MRLKTVVANIVMVCPPLFRFASKLYHRINGGFQTLSPGAPDAINKSFRYLVENDLPTSGDYYEFGLFRGYTFLKAYQSAKKQGFNDTQFYGFDSFEGLPPAEGVDKTDGRFFEGQFACSRDEVEKNLERSGLNLEDIALVEGFYEDSLTAELHTQYPFERAAVLFLDCDYYSSTKTALDWMDQYISEHTIILFDDWYSYGDSNELGQQKAFGEFLEAHPHFTSQELWEFKDHGKGFIIKESGTQ